MIVLNGVDLTLGDRQVLNNVSFHVKPGETMVILGGSGSGKTTILRVILGLYRPDGGLVRIDGQEITHLRNKSLSRIRQRMAMVFQSAALFDSLTVRENVGYRLWENQQLSDDEINRIVQESLRFVGLHDIIDRMPAELSGGMKKRVGIARALASGATVLLYDEPTAGLDPINTCLISRLIRRLKEKGVTQVVVTHDLNTAGQVADRIMMIDHGHMVFEGTLDGLQRSTHAAVRAFLDPGAFGCDDDTLFPQPIERVE
ncbi:MAG TPA: ATP-binding cassette domain-containing protein [Nitrospiraceae bacterium]|nr:ATP-binding cassette domain-containing protein [Nitrospiraceae bacterium]